MQLNLRCVLVQKSDSEEADGPKPHVKLRRAVSENPRPASTPPTIASADKEDREEDRIAAELEVGHHAARSHVTRLRAIRCSTTRKKLHLLFDSFPSDEIDVTTLSACRWQQTCSLAAVTTCSSSRYHMSPRPSAEVGGARNHTLLTHTHHHPGLTDHRLTDGP